MVSMTICTWVALVKLKNAVLTGQATEVPEINGKVNQTKPILISSIPKLTPGEGKIFNKHPCNFF